jgi:hypothetical protein
MGKTLLDTLAQSLKEFKAIVKGKASAKFGHALNSGDAIPIPTNRSSPLLPNPEAQSLILPPLPARCRLRASPPGSG